MTVDSTPSPEDRSSAAAHAEVIAVPVPGSDFRDMPDGAAQLTWVDQNGTERQAEVVQWRRLDRHGLVPGTRVRVDVQARQRRDMRVPSHHVSAHLMLTHNPADRAQVLIGDPHRAGSWAFGLTFTGAVLVAAAVPVDPL